MTDAYWHTRKELWSVREGGRVVEHVPSVMLVNVTLVVRQAGIARVQARRVREVVGWALGMRAVGWRGGGGTRIRFNPLRDWFFWTEEGVPVTTCRILHLEADGSAWGAGCR